MRAIRAFSYFIDTEQFSQVHTVLQRIPFLKS